MLVNQEILGLEVSVEYAMSMAVQQARVELMCELLPSAYQRSIFIYQRQISRHVQVMTYSASQLAKRLCGHCEHTLTISGVMGVLFLLPISMYRFRSTSRNSKTRYNFWSAWTISRSLDDVNGGTKRCARHVSSRDVLDDVIVL